MLEKMFNLIIKQGKRKTVTTSLLTVVYYVVKNYLYQIYKVSNFLPIQKVVCQAYFNEEFDSAKTLAIHNL